MKLKEEFKAYFSLPKTAYIILLSTIINRIGGFVGPMLTLVLSASYGMSDAAVGTFVSLNAGLGMVGTLLGGRVIDYIGSKYTRIIFHGLHGLLYLTLTLHSHIYLTLITLMLASFFSGFQAPTGSTLMMENTKDEDRKIAFSLNYVAINVGFSVGPLLAALLYKQNLQLLYWGDGISSLLSIGMIFLLVPHYAAKDDKTITKKEHKTSTLSLLKNSPHLYSLFIVIALNFIAFSQYNFGMPLTVKEIFTTEGINYYAHMMALNGIACMALTPVIGLITKKMLPSTAIALNSLLYIIGFGSFAFFRNYWLLMLATLVWSIGEILGAINTDVYIASHAPTSHRGRINSIAPLMRRTGFILGPFLAGLISTTFGTISIWYMVMITSFIAMNLMLKERRRSKLSMKKAA